MQLLVVEPDLLLGKTYKSHLKGLGHTVRLCQSASDAISALDKRSADVIILELNLPGHNGLEFLYEMRSYADWQSIPVIIHSFIPPSRIVNGMAYGELGILKYLYKPETSLADLSDSLSLLVRS